jgi:fumarylacetoacetase
MNNYSWIHVADDSDFPLQNIPFGICSYESKSPRAATIIGKYALDLALMHEFGYFDSLNLPVDIFNKPALNDFIALGKTTTSATRNLIIQLFEASNTTLRDHIEHKDAILIPVENVKMHLPVQIGDYTDFYSSREHATNVGSMFRDPNNALLPNWLHIPVGYHGRASSIVVSGTDIHRPKGQTNPDDTTPIFGPSKQMDFELEMGFIVGKNNDLGDAVSINEAEDYIFGLALFNDWSARDIQKWEYVPLGPFLGKNFASSLSPWIVTMDALEPFRCAGPKQETPEVLPYLKQNGSKNFDIQLEVFIQPENHQPHLVSHSNFKYMYWSMAQQLAHHTVNGCNMRVGDLCASGTISGPTPDSYGSMLEIAWKGTKPVQMPDGTERKFILDNDTVIMRGWAEKEGLRIGFGEVVGKILPAKA